MRYSISVFKSTPCSDRGLVHQEDYRVIRAIGKGSFGKVFLVRNEREKKQYVMKVISMKDIPKKEKYGHDLGTDAVTYSALSNALVAK